MECSVTLAFLLFNGILISYVYARKAGANENEDRFISLTPSERMQLMRQSAISKYGHAHEVDYNFNPNDFGGVLFDYIDDSPPPDVPKFIGDSELDPNVPYNIQNVRSVRVRETKPEAYRAALNARSIPPYFQPLCETHRRTVTLDDLFYDYRPNHYEEVHCVYPYTGTDDTEDSNVCNGGGFHCIQLNRTIFVTRRAKGTSCWELEPRRVPSGCECMWPKHIKGDIQYYH